MATMLKIKLLITFLDTENFDRTSYFGTRESCRTYTQPFVAIIDRYSLILRVLEYGALI